MRGLRLGLSLTGGRNPLADFVLALPFAGGGPYWMDGTSYSALSDVPGYSFSDSVDNLPNIDTDGYTALVSESSKLLMNTRPGGDALTDVDMLLWATVTVSSVTSSGQRWLLEVTDGTNNNRVTTLLDVDGLVQGQVITGGSVILAGQANGASATANTPITCIMRNTSGGWSPGALKSGTLSWGTTVDSFPSGMDTVRVGTWVNGGGNQPDAPISGAYIKQGTFGTDAAVLAAISPTL